MHNNLPGVKECPECAGDTSVIETRVQADGTIRRRRRCHSCGKAFYTVERYVDFPKGATACGRKSQDTTIATGSTKTL